MNSVVLFGPGVLILCSEVLKASVTPIVILS